MLHRLHRDGQRGRHRRRGAAHPRQLLQQAVCHPVRVGALHHHVDGGRRQDTVVLGLDALRGDGVHLVQVAVQLDARRAVAVKAAAGLPHAVQALVVELGLQTAAQRLLLDGDGLRVKDAVHQVGVKDGAEHNVGVLVGQALAGQGKLLLDAADVGRQQPVAAGAGQVHAQVGAVQRRQLAGQGGHIGAAGIAALQHQRQHGGVGGALPPGRVAQVDSNAAAVEFFGVQHVQKYAGRDLCALQKGVPPGSLQMGPPCGVGAGQPAAGRRRAV